MKKAYTLDYNIERDIDRLAAVNDILDKLETRPSNTDLELMASYILYGKDEEGKNSVQRKETLDSNKRYNSYKKRDDTNESLDAILESPIPNEQALHEIGSKDVYKQKPTPIRRPKYDKEGNLIDIGDSDIPGMTQLWEDIDRIARVVAVSEGKITDLRPDDQIITSSYRLYQLKHQLIDMRRHQYYLKDAYRPTIHFLNLPSPAKQLINFDQDTFYWMPYNKWLERVTNTYKTWISKNIEDYETRRNNNGELEVKWVVMRQNFDWENPNHISALVDYYSSLYAEVWDQPYSWGRTLIYDFDRYFDMCGFSPMREYILTRKIDKANHPTIAAEVKEKFGVNYNVDRIGWIIHKEIPKKMAECATRLRLINDENTPKKKCAKCHKSLPLHTLFFSHNAASPDNFNRYCKQCEKNKRLIKLGVDSAHDRRNKDTTMFKMPSA